LQDYPALVREQIAPLFGVSSAQGLTLGQNKTQQYRALAQASELQAGFANQQDYLRSLQLTVTLQRDALDQVARITELMNKSNQFNLSTRRLAAGDVQALMVRADARVYSFAVSDRLAEHGLTGVLITEDDGGGEGDTVVVHSFLMSCRVIGRGIEFAVWRAVCAEALARGKRRLRAAYHPTAKNAQVADFYDRLGLPRLAQASDGSRSYEADLAAVQLADSEWVELRNA
jgi:FkbH-like protein